MMSLVYGSEKLTLSQEAQSKMQEFEERKVRRKKEWVEELVKIVRTEILIAASLGKSYIYFHIDSAVHNLKPITVYVDGKEESYEVTSEDKDYLMTEVVKHYSDEKEYPHLSCRPGSTVNNTIYFRWMEETEEI